MEITKLTDFFRVVALLGALAFVIRFALTRWWQTWIGRCTMGFVSGCVLLLSLAVLRRVIGHMLPALVQLGSYILLSTMMWALFVVLMSTQRQRRGGDRDQVHSQSNRGRRARRNRG